MCRLNRRVKTKWWVLFLLFFVLSTFIFAEEEKDLLDMTLEELMNVKITTAARTPEKIGEIPASVVLITREDIEIYGYRTLDKILENIPGLYPINNYDEGGINFGVRGFWSGVPNDNMIIFVNDVPQVNNISSNYPLTNISVPVEAIDRIEIIRGPMSVIYGNGAFYGVINIFTNNFSRDGYNERNNEKPFNIISGSFGSEQIKRLFVRSEGNRKDFNYVLNFSLYDTYGINQPLSKMVADPSILPFFDVSEDQSTGGRLENSEKYFNFSGAFRNFYINLSYNEDEREFYYLIPSFSNGNQNKNNSTNISFGYKKKFSSKIAIDGRFNYLKNRDWQKYDFFSEDFYGIQQLESCAWETEFNAFFYPIDNLDIKTGLYYGAVFNASTMYDLPSFGTSSLENNYLYLENKKNIVTRAVFTQVNYRPTSKWKIIAGLRLEQMPIYSLGANLAGGTDDYLVVSKIYDQDEIEIIPRFAAIYTISKNHICKLLYGQAINRPSFFQNTLNLLLEPSKGSLKPESIQTLELNYISSLTPNFTFNASIFRNTLENLITRVGEINENGDYVTWSANAGKMVTQGAELTINTEPIENFRIELSGTYQETKDKRPGYENIEVAYSPKLLGYLKASYRINNFSLALTGNYVSAMETFWDESISNDDGSTGNRIGELVDGYFLLGANLRIENIFTKGIYLNLRISNLLNEGIRFPVFTNNSDWATKGTLGSGRTFMLSLGLNF